MKKKYLSCHPPFRGSLTRPFRWLSEPRIFDGRGSIVGFVGTSAAPINPTEDFIVNDVDKKVARPQGACVVVVVVVVLFFQPKICYPPGN